MDDTAEQHALVRRNPLGLLITQGPSGLIANAIPMLLRGNAPGILAMHVARANPHWREIGEGLDALAVFQDADAYVTPSWYASKQETGKVVPTWNYASVHVWGRARVRDDKDWIAQQIAELTMAHEASRERPWAVSDAPADYIDSMIRAIIGIEIEITRIEGKSKMSQNRTPADREGVIAGLRAETAPGASRVADMTAAALHSQPRD